MLFRTKRRNKNITWYWFVLKTPFLCHMQSVTIFIINLVHVKYLPLFHVFSFFMLLIFYFVQNWPSGICINHVAKSEDKQLFFTNTSINKTPVDSIRLSDRLKAVTIYPLRTGHCGLCVHLKLLHITDSALCACTESEETSTPSFKTALCIQTSGPRDLAQRSRSSNQAVGFRSRPGVHDQI